MKEQENNKNLTKMAKRVHEGFLKENQPITAKELAEKLKMSKKSIQYGIRMLLDHGLLYKYPNFKDLRETLYSFKDFQKHKFDEELFTTLKWTESIDN
ncbi:MAG: MarR family transcriptional regulator [Candidatus Hodarchaeales archaeon]|jgi:predicted transcriptional regulator